MVVPKTKVTPTTPVNVVLRYTPTTFEIKRDEAKPNWACATGSVPLEVRPSALVFALRRFTVSGVLWGPRPQVIAG